MEFKLWLLVFIYSVIHSVQSQNVRHRDDYFTLSKTGLREIKIASVLPATAWRPFSIRRVSPAVDIAMEKVNPTLASKNLTLVVKFRDSKCDIADGINEAINFYVHNEVHVIFGPCCDYAVAPVARQVRYWNIPMITAGGMAGDFGIKKIPVFSTLTRVGPNFNTLVHLFIKVLAYYKWNKVQLIYHPEGQQEVVNRHCHIAANDIHYGFRGAAMHPDISLVHTYKKFETNEEILGNLGEYIGLEYAGELIKLDFTVPRHAKFGTYPT